MWSVCQSRASCQIRRFSSAYATLCFREIIEYLHCIHCITLELCANLCTPTVGECNIFFCKQATCTAFCLLLKAPGDDGRRGKYGTQTTTIVDCWSCVASSCVYNAMVIGLEAPSCGFISVSWYLFYRVGRKMGPLCLTAHHIFNMLQPICMIFGKLKRCVVLNTCIKCI